MTQETAAVNPLIYTKVCNEKIMAFEMFEVFRIYIFTYSDWPIMLFNFLSQILFWILYYNCLCLKETNLFVFHKMYVLLFTKHYLTVTVVLGPIGTDEESTLKYFSSFTSVF